MELVQEIKKLYPEVKQNEIWSAIAENDVKNNPDYSAYNFRNKKQEDDYRKTGVVPSVTPSIYNEKAVAFIAKVLKDAK